VARKRATDSRARAHGGGERGPQRITSRNHHVVKEVRRLKRRTYRDDGGVFLVEGPNLLREAAGSGAAVRELLYVSDRAAEARLVCSRQAEPPASYEISDDLLEWISDVITSQGMLGVVEQLDVPLEEIEKREPSLLLVADQVRDPGNLGSLIRTADAAGAGGFVAMKGCADIYNTKVVRAAAGSHFHLPLARDIEMERLAAALEKRGLAAVGLDARAGRSYLDVDFTGPTAVFVGNEAYGFSPGHRTLLGETVRIDMPGRAESLNVASSAAIVIFEALRQRRNGG